MVPTSITIHSTGNPSSTAKNEREWLTNPSNTRIASWHICIDEREAIEAIPLDEVAFHAGNATGNHTSIGIEICESGNRIKTLENAVNLVAKLLKERGWGVDRLRRHFDWSGKMCPRIMSANNWQGWKEFVERVRKELVSVGNSAEQPSAWAKEAWEWAKKEGLLDGTNPKDPVTREMLAVVLKKVMQK
jgi:N-acetylmuramoyl-L-alanine amidase